MIYKQKNGRDAGRGDLFLSCVPAVTVVMDVSGGLSDVPDSQRCRASEHDDKSRSNEACCKFLHGDSSFILSRIPGDVHIFCCFNMNTNMNTIGRGRIIQKFYK